MPRTEKQNEALRTATRERLAGAAVRLFVRRGYAATSVRDIARAAGVSTGLMYRHYATKEALFAALVTQGAEGLERLVGRFGDAESPQAAIREFSAVMVADIAADDGASEFFQLMTQAFSMPDPPDEVRELVRQHYAVVEAVVALVEEGQRLGQFRAGDARQLATCYLAAVSGLVTMRLALGRDFVPPGADVLAGLLTGRNP
ncbi:TetR/AcrR family transcriptional regulator [Marinitenerispora sediminis]|nr:TetR/AcrR family transcriptional regulator [Marinitenerispora sediminis]